jgi:hypothetical protein
VLISRTATTPLQFIGSKKAHIPPYARDTQGCLGWLRRLGKAGGPTQQQRTENCLGERAHRESIMEFFRVLFTERIPAPHRLVL